MSITHSAHTVKKFDEELATLRDLVLKMGGLVEDQLSRAVAAVESGDIDAAREVVARDRDIDRLELKADEEIAQLLALRTPLGVDLRTVLTLSKTVNDLERIGDEAKKIAKIAVRLEDWRTQLRGRAELLEITGMARLGARMLHGALDALVRLDLDRAKQVGDEDDALDEAFRSATGKLKALMQAESALVPPAVELIFAGKSLERIGDHAKNIAEYVFYLVEGRDVRHPKANPAMARRGESE
jgi:phosphate transport system protein